MSIRNRVPTGLFYGRGLTAAIMLMFGDETRNPQLTQYTHKSAAKCQNLQAGEGSGGAARGRRF
jgi:hypothetical protein